MTVEQLIKKLQQVKNKSLKVNMIVKSRYGDSECVEVSTVGQWNKYVQEEITLFGSNDDKRGDTYE